MTLGFDTSQLHMANILRLIVVVSLDDDEWRISGNRRSISEDHLWSGRST